MDWSYMANGESGSRSHYSCEKALNWFWIPPGLHGSLSHMTQHCHHGLKVLIFWPSCFRIRDQVGQFNQSSECGSARSSFEGSFWAVPWLTLHNLKEIYGMDSPHPIPRVYYWHRVNAICNHICYWSECSVFMRCQANFKQKFWAAQRRWSESESDHHSVGKHTSAD